MLRIWLSGEWYVFRGRFLTEILPELAEHPLLARYAELVEDHLLDEIERGRTSGPWTLAIDTREVANERTR